MAAGSTDPSSAFPLPKILTYPASAPPILIAQGAEGRLYKTTYLRPDLPCALKYRPSKPYRHPVLDARLTRQRILAEARILTKCRRDAVASSTSSSSSIAGAVVPAVYALDEAAGWMMMEWIEGEPVRARLNEWLRRQQGDDDDNSVQGHPRLVSLMRRVGAAVGAIHRVGVVHGDLTTSNMILRPSPSVREGKGEDGEQLLDGDVVVIDFGLASQSTSDEDRAVDLYVLERAFGSTHPRAESFFSELLKGYQEVLKQAGPVLKKLEDVRMRGRKRSMIG